MRFSHGGTPTRKSGGGDEFGGESVGVTHKEREEKRKRHSMIMYELSAVLHGWRKECSDAFKKKIIMSRYSNTSLNIDFHWVLVLCSICLSANSQSG